MSQDATLQSTPNPPGTAAGAPRRHAVGYRFGTDKRYELVELLGRGGMSTVFRARDHILNQNVAIKFLGGEFAKRSNAKQLVAEEARRAMRLSHDNVVNVFHYDEDAGEPYIVMEYMRGRPLDQVVKEAPTGRPLDQAWPIIEGICHGLQYIHDRGMVHCDIKPANVFLTEKGVAKIFDLGIARASSRPNASHTVPVDVAVLNAMALAYASPEMFVREREPDPRDDIYALGCVVHELLTGRHPFERTWSVKLAKDPRALAPVPGLNRTRMRAIERALELQREKRTPSVAAFLQELEDPPNPLKRRLAAGALAVVLAGAAAFALLPSGENPDDAFVRTLLETAGSGELASSDQDRIANWIAQGSDYIEFARGAFAAGDALGGHRDLREGADNAERAFRSVLALTASEPAARGMLDIVNAYAYGTEVLRQSNPKTALWLACRGFELHPNNAALRKAIGEIGGSGPGHADVAGVCGGVAR